MAAIQERKICRKLLSLSLSLKNLQSPESFSSLTVSRFGRNNQPPESAELSATKTLQSGANFPKGKLCGVLRARIFADKRQPLFYAGAERWKGQNIIVAPDGEGRTESIDFSCSPKTEKETAAYA